MASDWLLPPEALNQSPSRTDGVSEEEERTLRRRTAIFIDTAGQGLKIHRVGIATAQVYFQRFFAVQSFKKFKRFDIAITCLFLSCKVEECLRKLDYLICTCHQIWYRLPKVKLKPGSQEYEALRQSVLTCERVLLHTIAFDLCVRHPLGEMIATVRQLYRSGLIEKDQQRPLANRADKFINDSMRTNLCLQYELGKIAHAAIFLATVFLELDLSTQSSKWLTPAAMFVRLAVWAGTLAVPLTMRVVGPSSTDVELADINHQIMQTHETTLTDARMQAMFSRFCSTPARPSSNTDTRRSRHRRHHPQPAAEHAPPSPPIAPPTKRAGGPGAHEADDPQAKRHRAAD